MKDDLKVLFVAAECSPFTKVGGLGDVAGELPSSLRELGADVRVVIPGNNGIDGPTAYKGDFPVNMGLRTETCIVREIINARVPTWMIDNYHYFGRPGVYGYADDAERFAFFCLSVYEMLQRFDFKPDILHLNDWHTAPLAMLLRENEKVRSEFSDTAIVYTIHNLEYQGISGRNTFDVFGVKDAVFQTDRVEYNGCFNAMKAGINYADIINSVSRTSARQMLTRKYGFGLEGVLKNRRAVLRGVVNGIDARAWSPETDKLIYKNYSAGDCAGKRENKGKLQKDLNLEETDAPLFSVVSRLVPDKGLDLMLMAAEAVVQNGGQFVLLGSGEKYYENAFLSLMDGYPGSVSVNVEFNNDKAHKIYAASDIFLMPSRYEPCGISQLIAMRYGTIPLVHKTGGLADTVKDEMKNTGKGTGFVFSGYSPESLLLALKDILRYYDNKEAWRGLIGRTMKVDSSWENSAKKYLSLYNEAIAENRNSKRKNKNENKSKSKGRKTTVEKKGKSKRRSEDT